VPVLRALLDQLDCAVEHASQPINFADVAKTFPPRLLIFADERGTLQLLSSAGNETTSDHSGEDAPG
jgi:hypothetical protein